jgi:hypothetical protein
MDPLRDNPRYKELIAAATARLAGKNTVAV